MASTELAIGVVLYGHSDAELSRLARSLDACARIPGAPRIRLMLWDNTPDGGMEARAKAVLGDQLYRRAGENIGFGAAHNRLMAEAFQGHARAYLCLNPDALMDPRCLLELEAEANAGSPGLVEARLFPDEHPKPYHPTTHETPWASGCVLRIDRRSWDVLHGFDERFFMYCEDVDLSWRARAAGLSVRVAPRALAHHSILRRKPTPWRDQLVRKSSALLGFKYGAKKYAEERRRAFLEAGGAPFEVPQPAPSAVRKFGDFRHPFAFAEPRW